MSVEITGFNWVPDFAKGYVRDLRPRWACEEIGLPYAMRLMHPMERPAEYREEQPWLQVPALRDGDVRLFESGAILLHLGEQDARLLPRDPMARARAIAWLFAAFSSVEPWMMQIGEVELFSNGAQWAELRRASLIESCGERLDRLAEALGNRDWLAGTFSIADIAMVTVLRDDCGTGVVTCRPVLAASVERGTARPAFRRALDAQLADFTAHAPKAA